MLRHPFSKRLGSQKAKNPAAARNGVEAACEIRYRTVRLEQKRQGALVRRQIVRQARGILRRLRFDAGERAFSLGLDSANSLAIKIQQVVRKAEARLHLE